MKRGNFFQVSIALYWELLSLPSVFPATKPLRATARGSYLVPAFQGPFPLLQHKTLVFIRPLDVALTDFQTLDYFPAVCLLKKKVTEIQRCVKTNPLTPPE